MPNRESETAIEADLQARGRDAPRLTPERIDAQITAEQFWIPEGTTVTVCCLTLTNGYCVIGESAAASPANFDSEIGARIARDKARDKIWALEGYLLRQRLHEGGA